jgi:hypothetical protein
MFAAGRMESCDVQDRPDEPRDGETWAGFEADCWDWPADILRRSGVDADGADLQRLAHHVELGDRVLAHLGDG